MLTCPLMSDPIQLGTPEAAQELLFDLYVELRQKLRKWSGVTRQTPQARMGYVGQHLVSAVTKFLGGRSGARGKDLILPNGRHAEIKTCYRVDQLGECSECGVVVSAVELRCPACSSTKIKRKDDSKWLIGAKSHQELIDLFDSTHFYLVLFDFTDLNDDLDIYARIWRVNPRTKAFAYCMIDYYHNIGTQSPSGAPFNLWPFKLKFDLLLGELIFQARIDQYDEITIELFDGHIDSARPHQLQPLTVYSRSGGSDFDADAVLAVCEHFNMQPESEIKSKLLKELEEERTAQPIPDEALSDAICDVLYGSRIKDHLGDLPAGVLAPSINL